MKNTNKKKALFVAAGGGGDALMSVILAEQLGVQEAYFSTLVWERLIFDPEPGPRSAIDFEGMKKLGNYNCLINKGSYLKSGAHSFLPGLSNALNKDFFLLDLTWGAPGVKKQLEELVDLIRPTMIYIVDAGGDILAKGNEPGLKSPLADSIVLAGAHKLKPKTSLIISALSLDGELKKEYLLALLNKLSTDNAASFKGRLNSGIAARYLPIFRWLPSEVTGLACLSAMGYKGLAEIRGQGYTVELDEESAAICMIEPEAAFKFNTLAQVIENENSLKEADRIIKKLTGRSELEYEQKKAAKRFTHTENAGINITELVNDLFQYSCEARNRGIAFLTIRRIGEVLALSYQNLEKLKVELECNYSKKYNPPVWIC